MTDAEGAAIKTVLDYVFNEIGAEPATLFEALKAIQSDHALRVLGNEVILGVLNTQCCKVAAELEALVTRKPETPVH